MRVFYQIKNMLFRFKRQKDNNVDMSSILQQKIKIKKNFNYFSCRNLEILIP